MEFWDVGLDGELFHRWWVFLSPSVKGLGESWEELVAPHDLCWVLSAHQRDLLSNGCVSANNRSSCNTFSPSEQALPDPCGKPCECAHSGRVLDPLYKRVQSQRLDIPCRICPVCFPILGSRCHSASVIPVIRNTEITRVIIFDPNRKTVEEACCGRGNSVLKSVRKSVSDLHSHSLTLPNKREGMSGSAFSS